MRNMDRSPTMIQKIIRELPREVQLDFLFTRRVLQSSCMLKL